jgi:GT2 family glycosyltransferase
MHVERPGLSAAYNLGIRETTGDILAFTDDDCIAPPGWLAAIEDAFSRNADSSLLYGQTLAPPEESEIPGTIPQLPIPSEEKLGKGHGFRIFGMGANFAIRRSLVARIGSFDEALGGGGPLRSSQDFDFQFRAFRGGEVTLLSPEVWVHHYGAREGEAWIATLRAYGAGDGAFYMKHVRCGDIYALRLLTFVLIKGFVREALNPIRRKPSQLAYLRSCFTGMRDSLSFEVDRNKRLYKLGSHTV